MNNMQGNKLAPTTKILILSCKPIIQSPALPDTENETTGLSSVNRKVVLIKMELNLGGRCY